MNRSISTPVKILFIIYIAILLRITVFREVFGFDHLFGGTIITDLFTSYIPIIQSGNWGYFIYLFVGNIIWFVPFGMLLRFYTKLSWYNILAAGFCLTFLIETGQFVFATGFSEIDDLVLNTVGTGIGILGIDIIQKCIMKKGRIL